MNTVYEARPINRSRSTRAELADLDHALTDLCADLHPITVRQAYYRAVVAGHVPKTERGYDKVQRRIVKLRRNGTIPYHWIVDSARTVYRTQTFNGIGGALERTAQFYRRDLWANAEQLVVVWCESDSIAGTISTTARKWALDLFPTRGNPSVSFVYQAAIAANADGRPLKILYIGDHDPTGLAIDQQAQDELARHAHVPIDWERLGVTWEQVQIMDLPGTNPKKPYGYPMAVEAEAIPPTVLRQLLDARVSELADPRQLDVILAAEESERQILTRMARDRNT